MAHTLSPADATRNSGEWSFGIRRAKRGRWHPMRSAYRPTSPGVGPLRSVFSCDLLSLVLSPSLRRALAAAKLQRKCLVVAPVLVDFREHLCRLRELCRQPAERFHFVPQHILPEALAF